MFKIPRTKADFGKINVRPEHHGQEIKPAVDVPYVVEGGKRLMDMLFPMKDGMKYSEKLYDKNGLFLCDAMRQMDVNRKPEGLSVTIWDSPTKKTMVLKYGAAKSKNLKVEFGDKFRCVLSGTLQLQIDPDRDASRLVSLMERSGDLEIIATQEDMFDKDEEEDETPAQTNLADNNEEDEEQEEEEEEEENDDE